MFERFTDSARRAVTDAQRQARTLNDRHIGTEHLLLALLEGEDATARELRRHGLDSTDLRERIMRRRRAARNELDPEALRAIGIDLDAVRAATEESFGAGALDVPADRIRAAARRRVPFDPGARKSLELSLRHALRLKHKHIESGHVLLGVLHDPTSPAAQLATEAGADLEALRTDVTHLLTTAAA